MPGERRTRRRKLPGPTARATVRRYGEGILQDQVTVATPFSLPGKQITVSEGHAWPPPKGSTGDVGGDFYSTRSYVASPRHFPVIKLTAQEPRQDGLKVYQEYLGNILPTIPSMHTEATIPWPPTLEMSPDNMDEKGAVAIKRCKPGDPINALSTTLGELAKDGVPALLGKSIVKARNSSEARKGIGGEFLNFTFGYKPIVSDVKSLLKTQRTAQQALEQFERDAGRNVRRKYKFPIQNSSSEEVQITGVYPWNINGFPGTTGMVGKVLRRRDVFQRVWFSGMFTYFLPPDWKSRDKLKELNAKANHLYEVRLTPETLWNLAPWSWATDWFATTGDVISNLESFKTNGLVMHYGYLMVHTIVTDTYSHVTTSGNPGTNLRVPELVLVTETKQRRKANPFGFGISWDGLSPSQIAIAAALGISR